MPVDALYYNLGHNFYTCIDYIHTKIGFLTPSPLSTCIYMGLTPSPPCGRPHAVRKNDPSLEKKSFGIHKFPQIFYISSTKISDDHFWFFALKFQKFRHS